MKLCYVANNRFPSERAHMTQIVAMCNAFASLGHEVTLCVTNRKTIITESPEEFFGVKLAFAIERLTIPDIAGNLHYVPKMIRPLLFLFQRMAFSWKAARYIKANHFDLIYGRDEWVLWPLIYQIETPLVWESHEAKCSALARALISACKKCIVISEGIKDVYLRQGIPDKYLYVAHDAVDDRFFEPHISVDEARMHTNINTHKPVVLYIGGLEVWKGVETLCRATQGQSNFETYIIGGTEHEIRAYHARYPETHFLGARPYRELPICQQAADILVIPNSARESVSSEYTSPLKLFSYMTAKKPIVASRVSSITRVLHDDEAFFFIPDDSQSLRSVIDDVLCDLKKCVPKIDRAYAKSMSFTWKNRARGIISFVMK
jgi:glycosyltransferase involved in cell wall biosynthesis